MSILTGTGLCQLIIVVGCSIKDFPCFFTTKSSSKSLRCDQERIYPWIIRAYTWLKRLKDCMAQYRLWLYMCLPCTVTRCSSKWCIVPGWRTEWSLTLYIEILFSVWSVPYYCEINMTYICCIGVDTFQHIWLKYLIKTQHQSPNCSWSASYKVKISYQHFALI